MHRLLPLAALGLLACEPPPATPARRTVEMYMHPNGLSRCVEEEGDRWKADASCCPEGFLPSGFSVPTAVEYLKKEKTQRTLYRHLICLEN